MMDYAVSVRLWLDMVSQGKLMRNAVGRFVQLLAFAVGLALMLSWIGLWTLIGTLGMWGNMALTVSQVVLLGAIIKVVQVMYVRGDDICQLPESDFAMMSIFSTLIRMPGEAALAFFALMSIPALLLVWSGAGHIINQFGVPVLDAHWAIAGVVAMTTCWVIGAGSFVLCAMIAEVSTALFTIAHDLRCTRRHLESKDNPNHAMRDHQMAA